MPLEGGGTGSGRFTSLTFIWARFSGDNVMLYVMALPYMTSAQKGGVKRFADKHCIEFADREGEGVKKSQNYVDHIYGSPLVVLPPYQLNL